VSTIKISTRRIDSLRTAAGRGPVLILTHDNPDPDGLASGKGLAHLLAQWGIPSDLRFGGIISRSENMAMHALLTPEWALVPVLEDLERYTAIAMLDTQPGAGNNSLFQVDTAQIVIDHHHPIRETMRKVPFADLRPHMGATSSMVFQYLATAEVDIPPELATALFYGLKTDTRSLSRGASRIDEIAYLRLLELIDRKLLVRVEQAGLPRFFYKEIVKALENTKVYGSAVIAVLGEMYRPDFASEIADFLIRLDGSKAVMCLGVYEQTLHLSMRTMLMAEDAGKMAQHIIIPPGKAGGHGTMAGGQFPIDDRQNLLYYIQEFSRRFLDLMRETQQGEPLLDTEF